MNKIINRRFLMVLVAAKIGVLATLLLLLTDVIQIGERMLWAEEAPAADKAKAGETSTAAAPGGDPARKSFLDGLLELPALNKDAPKKEEIARYLTLAERKRAQIEERMAQLGDREKMLIEIEKSIQEKLGRLDEERKFFAQTIQQEKEFKDKRQELIIEMYKKMEPKKAAPLMETMDKDLVVYLFNKMPNKQVTKILETMKPEKSVEITEYFGRVRSGREYDTLREMNKSLSKEFDICKGLPAEPAATAAQPAAATQTPPVAGADGAPTAAL
jgi:flagellar motility protein MotE (MotC chaperone)